MQKNITFENRQAHTLAGVLHMPDTGQPHACAIFAHCFTCTKSSRAAVRISEALAAEGITVLRFDFTGLGQSEGEFSDTHFSSNVNDLVDAAAFMHTRGQSPALLVGHSLGGTAVLAAAPEIESVAAVATIGSPASAGHVLRLIQQDMVEIENRGEATVCLAGRPFRISKDFVDDARTRSVVEDLPRLRKALLVMHSPVDEVVSIDQAALIYTNAKHPKSFVSLDDADHLLSRDQDSRYAARVLATWASRYVGYQTREPARVRYLPDSAVVSGDISDGFLVSVNANGHRFVADEPQQLGGTDLGPSPYDLLASALSTCTAMTLNFFARRENLPLSSVEVSVRHDRIHADDCENCTKTKGKIDHFSRDILLRGELDDEQRKLLLKIADRCPVHRTLENEIVIASKLR